MPMAMPVERPIALTVSSITNAGDFLALGREWDELVTASNDCLFLRHEFLRIWLESFEPSASIEVLTGRDPAGRLLAALPLIWERDTIRGIPVRQVKSMSNDHSCRFDMIAEDPGSAAVAFLNHLEQRNDWDVLRLADVPQEGQAWHLYETAADRGFPVGAWESQRSPYLLVPGSEEELQGRVSSQLRSTARRRQRQMEKRGTVRFEALNGNDPTPHLDDFFAVERSGWKGRDGTACSQDNQTCAFYSRLAKVAAKRGWLSLSRLTLDGETVAFQYGVTYNHQYLLPKLAFREEYSEFSPGLVLMHEVLRHCIARQTTKIDFLGADDEWKTRWSPSVLPHSWLYIFRKGIKGRLIRQMKFSWGPHMKSLMKTLGNRQSAEHKHS